MTFTSNQMDPILEEADADLLPGSADVEWAEWAYRYQPISLEDPVAATRRASQGGNLTRFGIFLAAIALVVAMAALVVIMVTPNGPSPTITHPVVSPMPKAVATTHTLPGISPTPPLLRSMLFSFEIPTVPKS